MKKTSLLLVTVLLLLGMVAVAACSSSMDMQGDNGSGKENTGKQGNGDNDRNGNKDIVIKTFERNGIKLQLVDITERFTEMSWETDKTVPVTHVRLENLPPGLRDAAENCGSSGRTEVFGMEYGGKTYYSLNSWILSTYINIFDEKGERCSFESFSYETFVKDLSNLCCILVLDTEVVKSAEGAPNYLIGFWQNDWQHLTYDNGQQATVALYPDLPFSMTEVLKFRDDGTGYLRTVKAYKDGHDEIALDPFRYELTGYHGGKEYGYDGYYYKCHFEAGDVIEYLVRSYDGMQTLDRLLALTNYPWFRKSGDSFETSVVNAGMKYGTPAKDSSSPIVGRWTAGSWTWIFRSDNTGYRLLDKLYNESFAYTVAYNGTEAEVTIYKYNTGFCASEGFAKDIVNLEFDPTIVPKGKTMKAKIHGNTMELEDWGTYIREDQ